MFNKLSLVALASTVAAQGQTPNLTAALASAPNLSSLAGVLTTVPDIVSALGSLQNITILAPSNNAFAQIPNDTLTSLSSSGAINAVLQYHVLNGTFRSSAITNTSAFVPTLLTNSSYANLTGGQVVNAKLNNGNVTFFTGYGDNSTVSTANVNFTGGVIHIIDRLLTIPPNVAAALPAYGLTSLAGALVNQSLVSAVNDLKDVTIFAPRNAAFQAIGSGLANLTSEQVKDILQYHVVANTAVGYSSSLKNGTVLKTINNKNLTITLGANGAVFVNNARVTIADALIANGVVHVIDNVLNPTNATTPASGAQNGAPAFSGASSVSATPFASLAPSATRSIAPAATSGAANPAAGTSSSSTAGAAKAMQTGSVGVGALLGAAAVYFL